MRFGASGKEREKIDKRRRKKNVFDSLIFFDDSLLGNQIRSPSATRYARSNEPLNQIQIFQRKRAVFIHLDSIK